MIIATSGCFLYLHDGHRDLIRWLDTLSSPQDIIYIAINTSEYLEEKKGKESESIGIRLGNVQKAIRDIMPLKNTRIMINDDLISRLEELHPRGKIAWVVGDDYLGKDFKEKEVANYVIFTKRIGISSTEIEVTNHGREVLDSCDPTPLESTPSSRHSQPTADA